MSGPASTSDDYLQFPYRMTHDPNGVGQFKAFENGQGVDPGTHHAWLADPGLLRPWYTAQVYFYLGPTVSLGNFPTPATSLPPATPGERFIPLEYWFYYPYNYYPAAVRSPLFEESPLAGSLLDVDLHQGDWEHVDILLNPKTDVPEWLYMARHSDEGQWLEWSTSKLARDGEHPIIQAAYGGHPSYQPGCARRRRARTGGSLSDWLVCATGRFAFRATTTPLVDMALTRWACWRGHFGEAASGVEVKDAAKPESARDLIRNFPLVAGPAAPLRQAENQGVCERGAIASEKQAVSPLSAQSRSVPPG
jgi:hypothetical protein